MFRGKFYSMFVEMGKYHFSLEEHRKIISAIERKDPAAARRAVSAHLSGVEGFLESDSSHAD
jgi:DNA-binding FadR family transcriptional regulator